ncbi:hypothetical protein NXV57_26080 [Bacteroides thetaiotaomicron]|nr:hypothetical protein [Bacteroides thetaiotaomicron]
MITDKKGMQFNIPVSLNIQFDCKVSHSWIHVGELPEFSGDIVQDVNIPIELDANDGFEDRTGYIVVKNQGDVVEVSDTLYVTQRLYSQIVYVKNLEPMVMVLAGRERLALSKKVCQPVLTMVICKCG